MSIFKKIIDNKNLSISLLTYHIFVIVIFLLNFQNGLWFLGWDSVNPEFNFSLNFERAIFASWQENYGVGLMGGHGFAATIPHTLMAAFISLSVPIESVRLIFTFFCWYLGGLGIFLLINLILKNILELNKHNDIFSKLSENICYVSLLSSLYYLVNLGTVQIFSIQLEAFIIHFAFLPWLFWIAIKLLKEKISKFYIILFLIINFLASGQGFIPSLFVAYFISLLIFLLVYFLLDKFKVQSIRRIILIITLTAAINSYWLFPFAYFTATRSSDVSFSYNNLISTPEMKDKSFKYGNLKNSVLVNGFYWESYELGTYVEESWRNHHENWLVPLIGYAVFVISILGVFSAWFIFKDKITKSLSFVFLYLFSNLAIATYPFNNLIETINNLFPVFAQAFRTTFTKLGIGTAFSISVFFALGLFSSLLITKKYSYKKNHKSINSILILMGILIVFYAKPLFGGNLLFKKMLITLPNSYIEIMSFFKENPGGRVADFPQNCADGWYGYNWNYFGSGFYWYAVEQPFMSRSFDVWSSHNENYYWQINQALIRQDFDEVNKILKFYDIGWILYDPNAFNCRDKKSVFGNEDLANYLDNQLDYSLERKFSDGVAKEIKIYKRKNSSNNFLQLVNRPINIGPKYNWTDSDVSSDPYITDEKSAYDLYFPFRELFTKRGIDSSNFNISEVQDQILLSTYLSKDLQGFKFIVPSSLQNNGHYNVRVELKEENNDELSVILFLQKPEIYLDGTLLNKKDKGHLLGKIEKNEANNIKLFINNEQSVSGNNTHFGSFNSKSKNSISISLINEKNKEVSIFWQEDVELKNHHEELLQSETVALPSYGEGKLEILYFKQFDTIQTGSVLNNFDSFKPINCGIHGDEVVGNDYEMLRDSYIRLISKDSRQCLSATIDKITTNNSYLVSFETRNLSGQNLRLKVVNNGNLTGTDLILNSDNFFNKKYLIMPPSFKNELGYDFIIENRSFSPEESINDIAKIHIWDFPFDFVKNLKLENLSIDDRLGEKVNKSLIVGHPNPTFYSVKLSEYSKEERDYLILYQSFASEWVALKSKNTFPYFEKLSDHVLYNNWANAWQLPEDLSSEQVIYIFFWPQLLQYLGFGLLLALPCFFLLKMR